MHFGASLSPITQNPERSKTISKTKPKNITSKRILKRRIDKKSDKYLNITIKISSRKRRLLYVFKQKSIKRNPRYEIVIISSLDNSSNKPLPILTLILTPNTDVVDIAMIDIDAHHTIYKLISAEIFTVFIKDLEF